MHATDPRPPLPWHILLGAAAALAITMGVGRFVYTQLLPLMQRDHGLDTHAGGWLASINFAGYLAGALYAALRVPAAQRTRWFGAGLLASVASTLGMGLGSGFALWALLRFVSGVAAALAMVLGGALVLERLPARHRAFGSGLMYGGMATGIVGSTLAVNLLDRFGLGVDALWLACGGLCVPLLWLVRPLFGPPPSTVVPARTAAQAVPMHLPWLIAAYTCAGYGYSTSATFLPLIVRGLGVSPAVVESTWLVVGLAALPASFAWGWVANRWGGARALDGAYLVQALGVGLPLLAPNAAGALAGAVLFGSSFIAVVGLALAIAREAEPTRASRAIGLMTAAYGVAQIVGPLVSARLSGPGDDFRLPLLLASGALLLGFGLLRLARPRPQLVAPAT